MLIRDHAFRPMQLKSMLFTTTEVYVCSLPYVHDDPPRRLRKRRQCVRYLALTTTMNQAFSCMQTLEQKAKSMSYFLCHTLLAKLARCRRGMNNTTSSTSSISNPNKPGPIPTPASHIEPCFSPP